MDIYLIVKMIDGNATILDNENDFHAETVNVYPSPFPLFATSWVLKLWHSSDGSAQLAKVGDSR